MSDPRSFWEEVERIFDPKRPVQDPALFARRETRYDPLARLEKLLRRPFGDQKYLVTGSVGNGKTSALFHLAQNLAGDRMVVFVDLWAHFQSRVRDPSALDRLEPWELIGLLGLAVVRAGQDRFGHRWEGEPQALERAMQALRRAEDAGAGVEIEVPQLARGLAIAAGGAVGAVAGGPVAAAAGAGAAQVALDAGLQVLDVVGEATSWTWRIGLQKRQQRSDQDAEVRSLLHAVNALIMALQRAYGRRLLLVLDGIDRIREPARLDVLFVHSSLLGELECDEVFTAPADLLDGAAQRAVSFRSYDLHNVPVLLREDPRLPGPGIAFFHELVNKRLARVAANLAARGSSMPCDAPIPAGVVDTLAYYSGGLAREFVRMIALAAGEAWEAQSVVVTESIVQAVLVEARGLKELRITREEIDLLKEVMQDPEHRLPDGSIAHQLLREQRLLPYPNDTPWYYPHPLLTLVLLKPGQR